MNYFQKKKLAFMSIVNRVKGFIRAITGALPLTLEGCVDEESIIDYTLYGQSVQNGTPTPETPIEVESVGEYDETTGKYKIPITLTGKNLLNLNDCYLDSTLQSQYGLSKPVIDGNSISCESIYTYHSSAISWKGNLEKGTYTVNGYSKTTSGTTSGILISVNGSVINNLSPSIKNVTFTLAEDSEVRIDFFRPYKMEIGETMTWYNIQLEKGSAVTAYEPYHKPITTNIYLDEPLRKVSNADRLYYENQICARGVKEYICKGNEGWYKNGEKDGLVRYFLGGKIPAGTARQRSILTNMYPQTNSYLSDWSQLNTVQAWGFTTQPGWIGVCVSIEDFPTVTDFKNFVATKYSEGNPLKMYFEISATETPITLPPIPTFKGTSIISADTTVQPSNAEIEYYSNVKE